MMRTYKEEGIDEKTKIFLKKSQIFFEKGLQNLIGSLIIIGLSFWDETVSYRLAAGELPWTMSGQSGDGHLPEAGGSRRKQHA